MGEPALVSQAVRAREAGGCWALTLIQSLNQHLLFPAARNFPSSGFIVPGWVYRSRGCCWEKGSEREAQQIKIVQNNSLSVLHLEELFAKAEVGRTGGR